MSCLPESILTLDDGSQSLIVHGNATATGTIGQADTDTGTGVVEYADGSAERWTRFEVRVWIFTMSGPAPSGLWALDLSAATWTATFPDPDSTSETVVATVIPARPEGAAKDINTAQRAWTLTLREAAAR